MAGPIKQATAKISKVFNGEPQSYSLFNAAKGADGDSSHVEVKLSAEGDKEMEVFEDGPNRPSGSNTLKPQRNFRKIAYLTGGVLLIFIIGFLIGYMTRRSLKISPKPESQDVLGSSEKKEESKDEGKVAPPQEPSLSWTDIKNILQNKLLPGAFDDKLRDFSLESHEAGSNGDETLANKVVEVFKSLNMKQWSEEHYVQLQVPSKEKPNRVFFGSEDVGQPKGYLAYSATGTETGKVVYANYGKMEDLKYLQNVGVDLNGTVVLLRAGEISFAQKVANAAQLGAVAVLIYQEPADHSSPTDTELYGHVHLGTGDPYTPGFPSFNHTQFPPAESSGLPEILAQTITADMAVKIHQKMGGKDAPESFKGKLNGFSKYTLGGENNVTVTVNNVLVSTRIYNVFGVIEGSNDPDRYLVIGAQRDSFGQGFAKSTVGTCMLVELAKVITEMIKAGFKPRRSIIFASWSAGDYGSVGATEWLEGYLASLDRKAFAYVSLDGTISGADSFKVSASPLLHKLLKQTMDEVKSPLDSDKTLFQTFGSRDFDEDALETMKMEDGAYPFLAFSGIPSVSFRFVSSASPSGYRYYGTALDTREKLDIATGHKLPELCVSAAQMAGQMALRLVHDHILRLDVESYTQVIRNQVIEINRRVLQLRRSRKFDSSVPLNSRWIISAQGSYGRAASALLNEIQNSDLEELAKCRSINDRIMRVEHDLLSPYVSPRDVPFRHLFFGSGDHTVAALLRHLQDLKEQVAGSDADLLRNQFALTTWTIQGCANDLAGDVWELDNQI